MVPRSSTAVVKMVSQLFLFEAEKCQLLVECVTTEDLSK